MSEKFKSEFKWQEIIPIPESLNGHLFHDRIVVFSVESGKIIKLSMNLEYTNEPELDWVDRMMGLDEEPSYYFLSVKAIEGMELLSGLMDLRFNCYLNDERLSWCEGSIDQFQQNS